MKPYWKRRWVKALRSGNYLQGSSTLRRQIPGERPRFCCLGVLCDIGVKAPWEPFEIVLNVYTFKGNQNFAAVLAQPILAQFGLSSTEQASLAALNDEEGMSFLEIADWIEEHL